MCPCFLHVDLSGEASWPEMIYCYDDVSDTTILTLQETDGNELIIPVNKGEIQFCAWGNLSNTAVDIGSQTIKASGECDEIWFFGKKVRTNCEDAYLKLTPQRQTREVTIILRGNILGISNVHTRITGMDNSFTFGGDVLTGNQVQVLPTLVSGPDSGSGMYLFQAQITRQAATSDALLELEFTSDDSVHTGTYEIGRLLYEAGEDLTESDGSPIVIDLVLGNSSIFVTIGVDGWTGHDTFEITY